MARKPNTASKGAVAEDDQPETAEKSLYQALEEVTEEALAAGDHKGYSTLHPVVVALAGVKFAASQAAHAQVNEDARELLERVRAL